MTPVLYLNPHGERAGAERVVDALARGHRSRVPQNYAPLVLCGTEGTFAAELRRDGIPVTVRQLRLRTLAGSVRWLREFLREHRVRVVHTTMAHYHQFAWLAARGLGVKTLWFNHGPCSKRWWKGWAFAFPADAVVVEGEFIRRCHRGFTLSPHPVVIPYGLEPRWFTDRPDKRAAFRTTWEIGANELAVGSLGRIEDWKRQHLFLRAIAKLPAAVVGTCRFLIGGTAALGRGPDYLQQLRQEHGDHPYRDRITLTGYVEAEDFWEGVDVAVHCAFEDPFPLVVLEALAKGKLVIGADSGGVPEMIADGVTGFATNPEDVNALAGLLVRVLAQPPEHDGLRAAARRMVAEQFSAARMVDRFEALYDSLLTGRPVSVAKLP